MTRTLIAPPRAPALVERGGGITLWRQIAQLMEREIAVLAPGDRLPTEAELSARFSVNRHTVRRAIEDLERRGLIRVEQGRGSFVAEETIDYRLAPRTRFSEIIARDQREPSRRILRVARIPANEEAAAALRLRRGTGLWLVDAVGMANGRPISVAAHHFPAARFPQLGPAIEAGRSISQALADAGVADYTRKSTRISARLPTAEEAGLLAQPRGRALLTTEVVNIDSAGVPVEYGVGRYPCPRVQLLVEF